MSDTHVLTRGKLTRALKDRQGRRLTDPKTGAKLPLQVILPDEAFAPTPEEIREFSDLLRLLRPELAESSPREPLDPELAGRG